MLRSTGRASSVTASYGELFAEPSLRRLALADVCARLPQGMVSIVLLLVAAQHASMTVAGLVVASYTLGQAMTGPLRGRLADRHGLVPVAAVCASGYAAALLALLASTLSRGPAGLDIGTAALAGLLNPPLSPGLRSLWSAQACARLKQTAFALDAAVFDLAYITGPVLASALATGLAPAAALGLMLALTAAAIITIARSSVRPPPRSGPAPRSGPPPTTGGLALLTAAGLYPPLLGVAAPLAGVCLGSTLATLFGAAAGAAPHGSETETQAWINSIMNVGAAGGAALAGFASGQPILALALATAAAAAAAVSAVLTSMLRPPVAPENPAGHARDLGSRPGSFG